MTDQEYVVSRYRQAVSHGPIKMADTGKTIFVIFGTPMQQLGEGSTEELAWANVAQILKES